ncbi:MAG: hypothetical protein ACK56F_20440, partial [bacterium]
VVGDADHRILGHVGAVVAEVVVGDAVALVGAGKVDRLHLLGAQAEHHAPRSPLIGVAAVERPHQLQVATGPLDHHGVAVVVEPAGVAVGVLGLANVGEAFTDRVVV